MTYTAYGSVKDYEESGGIEPSKRNTGITCEWKYPWNKTGACGLELTPKEVKYCDKHVDEFNGQYLCYPHQKRYIEPNKGKKLNGNEKIFDEHKSNT